MSIEHDRPLSTLPEVEEALQELCLRLCHVHGCAYVPVQAKERFKGLSEAQKRLELLGAARKARLARVLWCTPAQPHSSPALLCAAERSA